MAQLDNRRRNNNNNSHSIPIIARDTKIRKISKIIAASFLGINGESCSNPNYIIPNEFNNNRDKIRIASLAVLRIESRLTENSTMGSNCQTVINYRNAARHLDRRQIVLHFMDTMFEESSNQIERLPNGRQIIRLNDGGKKRKTLKKRKSKKIKRKSKRKSKKHRK